MEPMEGTHVETIPRQRPIISVKELVLQLFIVTAGVLIALLIDSLVEWNHYRTLVREARATIALEMAGNKKDIENVLASIEGYQKDLSEALRFSRELLSTGKTEVHTLNLNVHLAELSNAAWRTAERTDALSHMDYADVQRYSRLYDFQDLFAEHQRIVIGEVTQSMGVLADGDPMKASPADLERFRGHILTMAGELELLRQLGTQLVKNYQDILTTR